MVEFLLPDPFFGMKVGKYHEEISNALIAVGAMAIGLGIINLAMVHGSRVVFLRKGAAVSGALLVGLVAMAGLTLADWISEERDLRETKALNVIAAYADKITSESRVPTSQEMTLLRDSAGRELKILQSVRIQVDALLAEVPELEKAKVDDLRSRWTGAESDLVKAILPSSPSDARDIAIKVRALTSQHAALRTAATERSALKGAYKVLYDGLFISLGSAMFALLGFFIAAAAYRAFRVRSLESGLMMVAAVAVMLGQIPFGLWIWDGFPALRQWLLEVPSAGAFRAIKFGAAVAGLSMAIRMWFSVESRSFSTEEEQ